MYRSIETLEVNCIDVHVVFRLCVDMISIPNQDQCKRENLEIRPAVLVVLTRAVEAPLSMCSGITCQTN